MICMCGSWLFVPRKCLHFAINGMSYLANSKCCIVLGVTNCMLHLNLIYICLSYIQKEHKKQPCALCNTYKILFSWCISIPRNVSVYQKAVCCVCNCYHWWCFLLVSGCILLYPSQCIKDTAAPEWMRVVHLWPGVQKPRGKNLQLKWCILWSGTSGNLVEGDGSALLH